MRMGGWVIQCLGELLLKNLYLHMECRYLSRTLAMRLLGGVAIFGGGVGPHRWGPGRWWEGIPYCWSVGGVEVIEKSHLHSDMQQHVVLVHVGQFGDHPAIRHEAHS